jgi:hypothetical protein
MRARTAARRGRRRPPRRARRPRRFDPRESRWRRWCGGRWRRSSISGRSCPRYTARRGHHLVALRGGGAVGTAAPGLGDVEGSIGPEGEAAQELEASREHGRGGDRRLGRRGRTGARHGGAGGQRLIGLRGVAAQNPGGGEQGEGRRARRRRAPGEQGESVIRGSGHVDRGGETAVDGAVSRPIRRHQAVRCPSQAAIAKFGPCVSTQHSAASRGAAVFAWAQSGCRHGHPPLGAGLRCRDGSGSTRGDQ